MKITIPTALLPAALALASATALAVIREIPAIVRNGIRFERKLRARRMRRSGAAVSEIAERVNRSPSTVYRWTRRSPA